MASYDLSIKRPPGQGFHSLAEAKAHRTIVGKLQEQVELSQAWAASLRQADRVEVGEVGSELNVDLAPGRGHVIMLSQPEGQPLLGAELHYDPQSGTTRSLHVETPQGELNQVGSTYTLREGDVTTIFRHNPERGVFTVMDPEAEVPRIFGEADPNQLTAGTIQSGQGLLILPNP